MSDGQHGDAHGKGQNKRSEKSPVRGKAERKPRGADIGRALRSVYDDTLRESVPDDFSDLLGKLS